MVEYLYHVDKEDNVLEKIERNEAHAKGLLHRSGVVLVFNSKGELFLTERSPEKSIFSNCVDCASSFHVQYGQSYDEAAQAELFEETQIKEKPEYLGKFLLDEDPDHMIVAVYILSSDKKLVLDPSEAISGKFYSFEEADKIIKNKKTTGWLPESWEIYKKIKRGD